MKRWVLICAVCLLVVVCYAQKKDENDISSQRITRNQGEVVCVDTGLYFFKIRDEQGNETKFFAPLIKLNMIDIGEKIQVNYKKTTDGKLKALGIKEKKSRKKKATEFKIL
ncbi:MAG: hypothetical protein N2115_03560 [bacterium]|nr:hypothetical protein [bacterium]